MTAAVSQFINVPSTDPEDARRRKLLNILLSGLGVVAFLGLLVTIMVDVVNAPIGEPGAAADNLLPFLYFGSVASLAGVSLIYLVNRFWSGWVASWLLLILLVAVLSLGDEPLEVIGGRSLLFFAIPITMASVLLSPGTSFAAAGLVALVHGAIALQLQVVPNWLATLGLLVLALVSWLSARSLETALRELRIINEELDRRVADRTRDLAEALSREQAEASKNQAILEGIADGVIVFDRDARASVANPAVSRLLELPPRQIPGRRIEELMNGDVNGDDQEAVIRLLRDPGPAYSRITFAWGYRTLSASFAPVRGAPGQVTGTVAVFRDYTQEAEVDRMKSAFVSMVSHELRTPLNAILGYAEMLYESIYGPLLERQRSAAGRILTNTKRLLSIVNDLLDQAAMEAGRMTFQITSFAPAVLIEEMHSVVGEMARAKGVELKSRVDGTVPAKLRGDPHRLNQILVNLASNAIKFTERGSVAVRIGRPDPDHWLLEVSDTGPGIPPEEQPYIFDAFRQAESVTTRQHGGAGLGLAIVKRLVGLMGGEVTLQSDLGRGSTFTVVLPLVPPQENGA